MATGTYVTKRTAGSPNYYARILVPDDVRALVGRAEIWTSLRTSDEREARRRSGPVFAKHATDFENLRRTRPATDADLQQAAYDHFVAEMEQDRFSRSRMPKASDFARMQTTIREELTSGKTEITDTDRLMDLWTLANPLGQAQRDRGIRLKVLTEHLATGETILIHWAADEIISREALAITKGSPSYVELCQRLQRAEIAALKGAEDRDRGEWGTEPADHSIKAPSASQKVLTAKPGESITDRFEAFYRERSGSISADSWSQNRTALALFADFLGHSAHVTAITRKAVSAWKQQLMLWPSRAEHIKAFKGLGFKATIVKNATVGKPPISDKTINRYLSGIAPFCEWLLVNEHIEIDVMRGQYLILDKSIKKVRPYSDDQLATIFASPIFTGALSDRKEHQPGNHQIRDWRHWVPLLALYSGARLGELCQLNTADVRQIGDTWIMHVTTEGEGGKKTKTAGSARVIPLHPALIERGFLIFHAACVQAKQARLFPTLERDPRGQFGEPSRFFGRYLDRIGVKIDNTQNFHSFRHGIADAFRRAGYRDEEFAPLLGHVKGTTTARYGLLREGELSVLRAMIDAISFAGLQIVAK